MEIKAIATTSGGFIASVCIDSKGNILGAPILPKEYQIVSTKGLENPLIKKHWNGKEWEEAATVKEIEAAKYPDGRPDLETLRQMKLGEINAACASVIEAGADVETSQGTKHFSLSSQDQANIQGLAARASAGELDLTKGVPYHADGELCRFWAPEDFMAIASAATAFVYYHTTYVNHLRQYVKEIQNEKDLEAVYYGAELPKELAESLKKLLEANG